MIVTMRSEDLPAADRFAWWSEQLARDTAPSVVSSPHAADFRAVVTLADLGSARLSVMAFPEMRAVRTAALIPQSDPERYGLILFIGNALGFSQRDHDARLGTGTSYSMTPPSLTTDGHCPAPAWKRSWPATSPAPPPPSSRGDVGEPETERLGEVALNLAAATLAAELGAADQLAPETSRQALLCRIEAFIEHNLGDPGLTPTAIAARHHISAGYLHRLFESRELTVAARIRHLRLERCLADLADPRLRLRPVRATGARWGFRSPADFSRA